MKNNMLSYVKQFLLFKKLDENAKLPISSYEYDVGFDIFSNEKTVVPPGKVKVIKTGTALADFIEPLISENKIVAVPFLKIEGRSSLASKGIFPVGGIVDPGFRGELCVNIYNSSDKEFLVDSGDKIAQFVCYFALSSFVPFLKVDPAETNELKETQRNENGYGSSGK